MRGEHCGQEEPSAELAPRIRLLGEKRSRFRLGDASGLAHAVPEILGRSAGKFHLLGHCIRPYLVEAPRFDLHCGTWPAHQQHYVSALPL